MMHINYIGSLLIVMTLCCCSSSKKFKYPMDNNKSLHAVNPKEYKYFKPLKSSEYSVYLYLFKDSAKLYVTDQSNGGINYDNLVKSNQKNALFIAFMENDTISLNGIAENERYWRFDFYGEIGIDYKDVPESRKAVFDKVLDHVVIK